MELEFDDDDEDIEVGETHEVSFICFIIFFKEIYESEPGNIVMNN